MSQDIDEVVEVSIKPTRKGKKRTLADAQLEVVILHDKKKTNDSEYACSSQICLFQTVPVL